MSTAAESTSHLEPLRTKGSQVPLFLVHAMGGSPGCYRPLSSHMGERPVFGFRAARPTESDYPLTSVASMADAYVRSLNSTYSQGIVHLAGWSMGGLIAFEMARVLRRQGRQVGVLAMIDTWMRKEHLAEQRSADHLRILDFRRWRIHYKLVTGSIGVLEDNSHPFWQLDESARLEFLARAGSAVRSERYASPGGSERFQSESEAYMLLRRASDAYKPQAQATDLTFITADGERDEESVSIWKELVLGSVNVLVCPGSHLNIVDDPNAETLAHLLSSTMTTAELVRQA